MALVVGRKTGESIIIGKDIKITVIKDDAPGEIGM